MQIIEDLITAYAHDIDDDELETWPNYFTEDGTYTILTRENIPSSSVLEQIEEKQDSSEPQIPKSEQ